MASQQQSYVYWLKKAMAALGATNISTTGTLAVTGVSTLTGGVAGTPPLKVWNHVPVGALTTRGTDTAIADGTTYWQEVWLPANKTITGVGFLNGTVVGTDNLLVALYSSAGVLLANSALAGELSAGADTYQEIALTATYAAVGPARYFIAVQGNGTTAALQRNTTLGPLGANGSVAGTFGTLVDPITIVETHTDNIGPMAYLY